MFVYLRVLIIFHENYYHAPMNMQNRSFRVIDYELCHFLLSNHKARGQHQPLSELNSL